MTDLFINERLSGDVTILDLRGRVRMGAVAFGLHNRIHCLVDEGKIKVIVNLAGVTHIDSAGLGALISSYVALNDRGGTLKLVHLNERLREVMMITKLVTVFDVYDDESEALASFAGESLIANRSDQGTLPGLKRNVTS